MDRYRQTLDPILNAPLASAYTQYQFTATAADINSTLVFSFLNEGSVFHLDNVAVAPVPEPSTMLLLISGVLAVAATRRKGKKNWLKFR